MIQAIHFIILFFTILSYFFYICNKVIKYRFKSNDGSLKYCPKCAQPILKSVADTLDETLPRSGLWLRCILCSHLIADPFVNIEDCRHKEYTGGKPGRGIAQTHSQETHRRHH